MNIPNPSFHILKIILGLTEDQTQDLKHCRQVIRLYILNSHVPFQNVQSLRHT